MTSSTSEGPRPAKRPTPFDSDDGLCFHMAATFAAFSGFSRGGYRWVPTLGGFVSVSLPSLLVSPTCDGFWLWRATDEDMAAHASACGAMSGLSGCP